MSLLLFAALWVPEGTTSPPRRALYKLHMAWIFGGNVLGAATFDSFWINEPQAVVDLQHEQKLP